MIKLASLFKEDPDIEGLYILNVRVKIFDVKLTSADRSILQEFMKNSNKIKEKSVVWHGRILISTSDPHNPYHYSIGNIALEWLFDRIGAYHVRSSMGSDLITNFRM